jgi:molybdate transport system regulatory protein
MAGYTGWLDRRCLLLSRLLPWGMTRLVLQLHFDAENRIGPGKMDVLEQIERTGSISAAGRAMNMSYRRAWLLVDAMNRTFHAPVVATRLGGTSAGRAWLTPLGREVVQLYREIGEVARGAASPRINRLEQLIAEGAKRTSRGNARTSAVPRVANDASRSVVHASSSAGKLPRRR